VRLYTHGIWTAGILGEDDRVELIAGEIIEMAAFGVRHANCVRAWIQLLRGLVPHGMLIDIQNPIKVRNDGEPQPDVAVLYDRAYDTTPTEADALFVVEVSDSSLAYDRSTKLPSPLKSVVWASSIVVFFRCLQKEIGYDDGYQAAGVRSAR